MAVVAYVLSYGVWYHNALIRDRALGFHGLYFFHPEDGGDGGRSWFQRELPFRIFYSPLNLPHRLIGGEAYGEIPLFRLGG